MTYPPQPGPAPYGQYPGGPVPGNVGQYPVSGPPGPYGQPAGFGPPPPSGGGKAGLWIGVGIASVALVAFLITAFVAPGFLLGDDSESGGADGPLAAGGTARDLGDRIGDALQSGQPGAVTPLLCQDATDPLKKFAEGLREPQPPSYVEVTERDGTASAVLTLSGPALGKPEITGQVTATGTLANQETGWCWRDFQDASGYLGQIGAALNSGDLDTLQAMKCQNGPVSLGDPLADAVAAGGPYTARNVSFSGRMASADFVAAGGSLSVSTSVDKGRFCLLSARPGTA
ncbi:hypothetical protein B1813_09935 [Saccharomonospora piscinae]|uniref:Uncharacterized protein n=1 Tax=Saccharomonospora piscinae TaxID=687388 RepID=A0A1V9A6E6_SACPI|nr:hypothetical protein [Saccharomonospora piscinae]OQO92504.1 hypothetical protein B1813_09935 [Saccharomonospora piscinae]